MTGLVHSVSSLSLMPQLQVIPARTHHLRAIAALDHICFGGLWSEEAYQREIDSPNSDLLLLTEASRLNDLTPEASPTAPSQEIVGLACLWSILEEAHITILAVHPQHRRHGYGRVLLTALLTAAYSRGLEWATLEVRPSNQAAVHLYQSFGFEEVGRRRKYYPDQEDALILWRKGLQTDLFQTHLQLWQSQVDPSIAIALA